MVTEDEYSIISDLARVRSAISVLQGICPELGSDCIPKAEWQETMQRLMKWGESLNEEIKINDS